MPAQPPTPATMRVRLIGLKGASTWNNILHVRYAGTAPTESDLTTFANAFGAQWTASLAPLASLNTELTEIQVTDLTSNQAAQVSVSMAHPGTRVGADFTAQVAMVGSWIGNLRYRGGHLRTYWPFGVQTDQATLQHWSDTFQIEATTALRAFRTAVNALVVGTASCTLTGVSYITAGAPRPTPVFITISDVAVHQRIDTIRHRLGKEAA